MSSQPVSAQPSKAAYWTGWVLSVLPALLLAFSASGKLMQPEGMEEQVATMGWPMSVMLALGVVELGSAVLYLIPQTAALGAVLLTGYLGGAVAAHVRMSDWSHAWVPFLVGVVVWLGLYLRDPRVRDILPLRRPM